MAEILYTKEPKGGEKPQAKEFIDGKDVSGSPFKIDTHDGHFHISYQGLDFPVAIKSYVMSTRIRSIFEKTLASRKECIATESEAWLSVFQSGCEIFETSELKEGWAKAAWVSIVDMSGIREAMINFVNSATTREIQLAKTKKNAILASK